jgi:biopolymer transport protein ExbB
MRISFYVLALCVLLSIAWAAETVTSAKPPPDAGAVSETAEDAAEGGTIRGKNLWETLSRGGPLMIPILLCSLVGVAFAIERAVSLRQSAVAPRDLQEDVLNAMADGGTAAALDACEQRPSAMSRVLMAGLRLGNAPRDEINLAMSEAGERELWALERLAKPLSIIAGVAPLLGLLGTVWGMILAFDVVAQKGALGDPRQLANGIATALLTTLAGLSVAIPCYIFYHYFRSKSDRMIVEIEETASHVAAVLKGTIADAHSPTSRGGGGAAPDAAD